ncbi:MAG: hypothetical protein JXI33_04910 [Candidatus Aminicenantes bacterium]|nr:hypothetical protein [Candidatus Aminicenantes bacterium]
MTGGITIILAAIYLFLGTKVPEPAALEPSTRAGLTQVQAWREKAADLHPAFAKTYPVALVENGRWYVYEVDATGKSWKLSARASVRSQLPAGIRAAMPLDFWNFRMACVVSPEIFYSPEGYAVILHEFVHCFQWETVEGKLKEGLAVNREALARGDYMWELQYPFPYDHAEIRRAYGSWLLALQKGQRRKAGRWRAVIKKILNRRDWEYMTWQEWKEGLARYLENQVRIRFGLKTNRPDPDAPFNRISFYRGGELFIMYLQEDEPGLDKDLERLYLRIFASGS